jgi:outer membrane biosynthesis protein TonB
VTPEPEPEPVATEPEPVVAVPEPVATEPELVTPEPEPESVVSEPEPEPAAEAKPAKPTRAAKRAKPPRASRRRAAAEPTPGQAAEPAPPKRRAPAPTAQTSNEPAPVAAGRPPAPESSVDVEALFNLGVSRFDAGDLEGAESAWRQCLPHEHARAATNLGFLFERAGDLDRARLAYLTGARWGDPVGLELAQHLAGTEQPQRGRR